MPNLFPSEQTDVQAEEVILDDEEVVFGRSWVFDYEKGDFVLSPTGKVKQSDGVQAWLEWCKKALKTVRYRFPVYSFDFGQEFEDLVRRNLTREANESEIQRMVTEALMVNPRTESVGGFSYEWERDAVYFTFKVTNIWGDSISMSESVVISSG